MDEESNLHSWVYIEFGGNDETTHSPPTMNELHMPADIRAHYVDLQRLQSSVLRRQSCLID